MTKGRAEEPSISRPEYYQHAVADLGAIIAGVATFGRFTGAGNIMGQAISVFISGALSTISIYATAEPIGVAFAVEQKCP